MRLQNKIRTLVVLAVIFLPPWKADAFYDAKGDGYELDARGYFDVAASFSKNPDAPLLYPNRYDEGYGFTSRLMVGETSGDWFAFEFNGLAYGLGSSSPIPVFPDVERSSAVEWVVHDGAYIRSHVVVDHLNVRFSRGGVDLIAGRQAINLATCFFFTPNDLFAPFAAQTFYRVFKPGVDAARLEVRLGGLSQLTLVAAEGYAPDPSGANGWSASPDIGRASYVARAVTTFSNFQWGVVAGKMANFDLVGGSMQGEVFNWLGIRGEGHVEFAGADSRALAAVGLEHRFNNGVTARYEEFYNGAGAASAGQYRLATWYSTQYHGLNYGALGFDYQFTPLWSASAVAIANFTDGSDLAAFNAVYSLADNSEIWFGLFLPGGAGASASPGLPSSVVPGSEYGLYPYSATVDLRMYF
ncbi:MAG: hypothetical protein HY098_08000 [Nitrospinae bacterium]|nr:hypothetical protein [Nitrospinota bacterium]